MEENYSKSKKIKKTKKVKVVKNTNKKVPISKESKESIDTANFIRKTVSKLENFYNKIQFGEQFNISSSTAMVNKIKKIYSNTSLIIEDDEDYNQVLQITEPKKPKITDSAVHFLLKSIYDVVLTKDEIFIYIIDSINNVVFVFNSKIGENYNEITDDYIIHYINCPEKIYKFRYPELEPEMQEIKYC